MNVRGNLDKRISMLEEKLNPDIKVLIVLVNKDDTSQEEAKKRVLKEQNIKQLPDNCTVFIIDMYRRYREDT